SDALLVKLSERNRRRQEVAVIGNLLELHCIVQIVTESHLEEARHCSVQDAEAILAAFNFKERLVSQVHGHCIAQEPVKVEDVEVQLAVRIESLVGQHDIDVVIQVAPTLAV